MKGWNLPFDGRDTQFKDGDPRTVRAGRAGGIRSGEVRRRRADLRKHMVRMVADAVYCNYLTDVVEDELRDFIAWRGQKKRKDTLLAKAVLEDSEDAEEDRETIKEVLEKWQCWNWKGHIRKDILSPRNFTAFNTAMAKSIDYSDVRHLFGSLINDLAWAFEDVFEAEMKR